MTGDAGFRTEEIHRLYTFCSSLPGSPPHRGGCSQGQVKASGCLTRTCSSASSLSWYTGRRTDATRIFLHFISNFAFAKICLYQKCQPMRVLCLLKWNKAPGSPGEGHRPPGRWLLQSPWQAGNTVSPQSWAAGASEPLPAYTGWICHSDSSLLVSASPEGSGSLPNIMGGCYSPHSPGPPPHLLLYAPTFLLPSRPLDGLEVQMMRKHSYFPCPERPWSAK